MPTKRKKKRKSSRKSNSSYPQPLYTVDPKLVQDNRNPSIGISAPYEYPSTDTPVPYTRSPERIGGTDLETAVTTSGTRTTAIGTVSADSILLNYSLSGAILSGSITAPVRFRLDIVRGGVTIFSVNTIVAAIPGQNSIASNAEIVLQIGDVVNLVTVRGNMTSVTYSCAAQLMLQPYK